MEKPQLLIVEDNTDLSDMLNAYFRVQSYDVLVANWGEEAIKLSLEYDVDLVVLDIRLPDIDGYEVCRRLRSNRKTQDVPVIFLTEKRDRIDKLQGLELGVVDYITKPFDIQELRLRVRNAISRAQRHALVNPVTDIPEGSAAQERVSSLLLSDERWAILQLTISSLGAFRERYGFVAADDVLRAVTLMIKNAVRDYGAPDDYIGHASPESFFIISTVEKAEEIKSRFEARIEQSREYFYPLRDRDKAREAMEENLLRIDSHIVRHSDAAFTTVDQLLEAIDFTL